MKKKSVSVDSQTHGDTAIQVERPVTSTLHFVKW